MTHTELKAHRESLGLSQRQFSAKIGANLRTYQGWEQGKYPVPNWLIKRISNHRRKP